MASSSKKARDAGAIMKGLEGCRCNEAMLRYTDAFKRCLDTCGTNRAILNDKKAENWRKSGDVGFLRLWKFFFQFLDLSLSGSGSSAPYSNVELYPQDCFIQFHKVFLKFSSATSDSVSP